MCGSGKNYEFSHLSFSRDDVYAQLKNIIQKEKSKINVDTQEINFNSTTALVHELFIKLRGSGSSLISSTERKFIRNLTSVARFVITDEVRKQTAKKREVVEESQLNSINYDSLLKIDELIEKMYERYPDQIETASLYYFSGMSKAEISKVVGITEATVDNYLKFFRALMRSEILD